MTAWIVFLVSLFAAPSLRQDINVLTIGNVGEASKCNRLLYSAEQRAAAHALLDVLMVVATIEHPDEPRAFVHLDRCENVTSPSCVHRALCVGINDHEVCTPAESC